MVEYIFFVGAAGGEQSHFRTQFLILFSFFLSFFKIYLLYNVLSACVPTGQKRAPDLIIDG